MNIQHPLLKTLCDKGLSVDDSMELVQYCLQELGKHSKPSPETLERLDRLEQKTEGLEEVVTFVRSIMKNEEWWNGAKQRATTLISRGRYLGTVIVAILIAIATIKGWFLILIQWALSELKK